MATQVRTDYVTPLEIEDYFKEAEENNDTLRGSCDTLRGSNDALRGEVTSLSYTLEKERKERNETEKQSIIDLQQQLRQVQSELAISVKSKEETEKQYEHATTN